MKDSPEYGTSIGVHLVRSHRDRISSAPAALMPRHQNGPAILSVSYHPKILELLHNT